MLVVKLIAHSIATFSLILLLFGGVCKSFLMIDMDEDDVNRVMFILSVVILIGVWV